MFSKIKHNYNNWFIIDFNYILKECYNNIILHMNINNSNPKLLSDKIKKTIISIIDTHNYQSKNIIIVYDNKLDQDIKECFNIIDTYIINFFNEYEFIFYNNNIYNNTDIIAVITNIISNNNNVDIIRIISNNHIFYQLINDKILILNINCQEDTMHILSSGKVNLWYNIINGLDTKLKFNNDFISYFISSNMNNNIDDLSINNNIDYRYLTKKELYLFLHNIDVLEKILSKNPNIVLNQQHLINQSLVDFTKIPINIVNEIKIDFCKLYQKTDEFVYYKNKSHHKKYINNTFCKKTYIKKHTNNSINNNSYNNNIFIVLDIDNI